MTAEHIVAKVAELADGQMKEVAVGQTPVLLARVGGQFRAFGASCPHAGAPLAKGLLAGGHVRCPWHQSVFDLTTGRMTAPPAIDGLPQFACRVAGDDVLVTLPEPPPEYAEPEMADFNPAADGRTFVILGAGAAGLTAAEALRVRGFQGRVVLVTREKHLPYDRTALSKGYLSKATARKPFFRTAEFYARHGIELATGRTVTQADTLAKAVHFDAGPPLRYDRLLVATGSVPNKLGVRGEDLPNVFTLRSFDDCEAIRGWIEHSARVLVVGGSFIAMEAAASLRQWQVPVTVVAPAAPFRRVLGERIGAMYQALHEENGVTFRIGKRVQRLEGAGRVEAAVLEGGERVEADLVVVGVGVRPDASCLRGVAVNADGSVDVDSHLRAGPDVWAAGDIARFPDWRDGQRTRIEHWRLAQQHGLVAAANMAGGEDEFRQVPFFWTNQHKVSTQYVGSAAAWDEIVYDGDVAVREFLAYFVRAGRVRAAAGCKRGLPLCRLAELLATTPLPTLAEARHAAEGAAVA